MTSRATPALENRAIAWVGICLICGYGWFLTSVYGHYFTLLGHNDFSVFWAAGRLALAGKAAAAYDVAAIGDILKRASPGDPTLPYIVLFFYPPWFLIVLAPFGALAYATAALAWLAGTLAVYLAAVRAILRGGAALIAALAAPPVLLNVLMGQNGLLSAGLFGGALVLLDRAPIAAGVLIGLLAYKPHFGLLLPLFLALTGRWRVFASAAATVAGLAGLTGLLFGADVFAQFARAIPAAGHNYLLQGRLTTLAAKDPDWEAMTSAYALLRLAGAGAASAWCGHIAVAAATASATLWVAAGNARSEIKAAAVATAAVTIPPYCTYYDLAILTVPVAFLVRDGLSFGFRRYERSALSAVLLLPLLFVGSMFAPWWHANSLIGPVMCAILAAIVGRRILRSDIAPTRSETAEPAR